MASITESPNNIKEKLQSSGVDLSTAGLIEGGFSAASEISWTGTISNTQLSQYFPSAKIGGGNYIYVGHINSLGGNWFGIEAIEAVADVTTQEQDNIPVSMAYKIDSKIDDGMPFSGNVLARKEIGCCGDPWVPGTNNGAVWPVYINSLTPSSSTCIDSSMGYTVPAGAPFAGDPVPNYSTGFNNGAGGNCALIIRMQGGD